MSFYSFTKAVSSIIPLYTYGSNQIISCSNNFFTFYDIIKTMYAISIRNTGSIDTLYAMDRLGLYLSV